MENLDNLLDMSLDELADLPEFVVYPAGAYRCTLNIEAKKIGEHPAVELSFKHIETVEKGSETDEDVTPGTECSAAFMLDNQFGQGNLKKVVAPLVAHFGTPKLSEIAANKDLEVLLVSKTRQNKDKTQTYLDIISLQVA